MKRATTETLPDHLQAEAKVLQTMPESAIDFSDIPATTDFSRFVRRNYSGLADLSVRRIALPEPVARIYQAVEELEKRFHGRRFTPDGHLVGSIGEVIAAEALGLTLYPMGRAGHDARDQQGRDVQIKMTAGVSVAMYDTSDWLVVLRVVSPQEAEIVYDGPGQPAWDAARPKAKNGQRVVSLAKLRRIAITLPA